MDSKSHMLMLFLAAALWGTTFVAQSIGADYVGACTYLAGRSFVAVAFLTPVIGIMDRVRAARGTKGKKPGTAAEKRLLFLAGICCGATLFPASFVQQVGMAYTTASKASFVTALYIVIVPIMSIFLGKKPGKIIFISVGIALIGMYLLCLTRDRLVPEIGDAYILACAVIFSAEILIVDHFSPLVDGVRLSRLQFLVVAVVSTPLAFLFEKPEAEALIAAVPAILYAGIFSSGIAYTFQILGQDHVNPSLASLIMSLESVFGALSGWAILGEKMSARELMGSALIFAAVILAQLRPAGSDSK